MRSTILALLLAAPASAEFSAELVSRLKSSVVNIEVSVQHGLNAESTGKRGGTGFIVDAERGIIATNRHVVGTSPALIKIVFEDGSTAEARIWYYDAWHDFAFIKLEPDPVRPALKAVALGDSFALKEQEDVLLVGNNDAQEYSVKFGKTANLWLCRDRRHSATLQTTFDRAGGSSGSPVFNSSGQVVAIHFSGTDTTSFEMRVEYLKDVLAQLNRDGKAQRGEIGVDLDTILISDARKHFKLPEDLAKELSALRADSKRVAVVEYVSPRSPAAGQLMAGDIVLKVEGRWVGDDVYLFDKLVDEKVGKKAALSVLRNGRPLVVRLPVEDAEAWKVRQFVLFAGGVVHATTPEHRLALNIESDGVFLPQAEKGSSFSDLGREGSPTKYLLLIESVNGVPTPDLDRFVEVVRGLKDGDHIYVNVSDRWRTQSNTQSRTVRLDLKYFPLRVFDWSEKKLEWQPRGG
ncbi:MAG: trypsin-like peptidase domain-containing protein [Elusimicrobia bacterium]|nr:trypsin-like peptidase domain-containing protein [Elusimicrobiota bacterium]